MQAQRAAQDHQAAATQAAQAQAERDALMVQLANTAGRLESAQQQVREWAARAGAAPASTPARAGKARRGSGEAAQPLEAPPLPEGRL
jgi:hypothetical protein